MVGYRVSGLKHSMRKTRSSLFVMESRLYIYNSYSVYQLSLIAF